MIFSKQNNCIFQLLENWIKINSAGKKMFYIQYESPNFLINLELFRSLSYTKPDCSEEYILDEIKWNKNSYDWIEKFI